MTAYVYQADLYCEDCAEKIMDKRADFVGPQAREDSEEWPQAYPDGGGEADCPHHCAECNLFLQNPLTSDGCEYVLESVAEWLHTGQGNCARHWAEFYNVTLSDLAERAKRLNKRSR